MVVAWIYIPLLMFMAPCFSDSKYHVKMESGVESAGRFKGLQNLKFMARECLTIPTRINTLQILSPYFEVAIAS